MKTESYICIDPSMAKINDADEDGYLVELKFHAEADDLPEDKKLALVQFFEAALQLSLQWNQAQKRTRPSL